MVAKRRRSNFHFDGLSDRASASGNALLHKLLFVYIDDTQTHQSANGIENMTGAEQTDHF